MPSTVTPPKPQARSALVPQPWGREAPREVEAEGPRGPPRQLTSTWPGVHGGPSLSAGAASPREPRARSCRLALPVG